MAPKRRRAAAAPSPKAAILLRLSGPERTAARRLALQTGTTVQGLLLGLLRGALKAARIAPDATTLDPRQLRITYEPEKR